MKQTLNVLTTVKFDCLPNASRIPKGNEEFPIGSEGVLVELVQAPDTVIKAFQTIADASL